jgi:hypothetical protein
MQNLFVSRDTKERLEGFSERVGVALRIDAQGSYHRVLVDSQADLVFDEIIVGYIEEEMALSLSDDNQSAPLGWRRLGIIGAEQNREAAFLTVAV